MAATPEQVEAVKKLEAAHKKLFYSIVAATQFLQGLSTKYAGLPETDPRRISMLNYTKKIIAQIGSWHATQSDLERAGIPKIGVEIKDFFDRKKSKYLLDLVEQMNAEKATKGMGFIPLLIWAVMIVVGMWSTKEIVNKVNSTEAQQKALVDSTNNFCKDNGLTTDDCKEIFVKQQESVKSGNENKEDGIFDTLKKLLLWGGLGFAAVKIYQTSQTKKAV